MASSKISLKKSWVHLNDISPHCAATWCSAAVTEELSLEGRECVRQICIYKLFKLYEMHVVYTCLSIYIWCMNICVLFIERRLLKKQKIVKKKKKGTKQAMNLLWDYNTELGCKGASQWDFICALTGVAAEQRDVNHWCRKCFGCEPKRRNIWHKCLVNPEGN